MQTSYNRVIFDNSEMWTVYMQGVYQSTSIMACLQGVAYLPAILVNNYQELLNQALEMMEEDFNLYSITIQNPVNTSRLNHLSNPMVQQDIDVIYKQLALQLWFMLKTVGLNKSELAMMVEECGVDYLILGVHHAV